MITEDSTLEKDYHLAIYVDGSDGQSTHDVAQDAEAQTCYELQAEQS